MQYELEPDNRNCSDEELLNDLRIIAQRLGKASLTKDDYNRHGRFSAATMQKRFGSWNIALDRSGLELAKRVNIPQEELIEDLKRVAALVKSESVTTKVYAESGRFSVATITRAFSSWADAVAAAGLGPTNWRPAATNDQLFSNMAAVWEYVGRQPKQSDFRPPTSLYSHDVYVRRFNGWRAALRAFIESVSDKEASFEASAESQADTVSLEEEQPKKRTSRNPGWRLRYLVMHRDNLTCQHCGRSRAKQGVVLVLDHKIPWSAGGETTFENLQTLCEECNGGKSNLILSAE